MSMLFSNCPINRDTCDGCGNYETCAEYHKIGYESSSEHNKTKQASSFERCLDSAIRQIGKVWAALEETQDKLRVKDIEGANMAAFEATDSSEKLTKLIRGLPAYSGHPKAMEMIEGAMSKNFPVEIGYTQEGWFCLRIPILLPKKSKGSPDYITEPIYPAMRRFWEGRKPIRFAHTVVVFRHVYSRERPERQYRDHDNIELNKVLDIVAQYAMADDSPLICDHYYCSAPGDSERTEVYVLPQNWFGNWLSLKDSIPEQGVKLYEDIV
jgi:hypothetical protein